MYEKLKQRVYETNLDLQKQGLVVLTWGNVSAIDRGEGIIAIKPSGVRYEDLAPESIVIVNLDGKVVEGTLKPSSDTATHLELYKSFAGVGGICHTHSMYATMWSQARPSDSVLRHDSCGQFLRPDSRHRCDDRRRDRRLLRREYGQSDRAAVRRPGPDAESRRCWSPITGPLPGARAPRRRSKMPWSWSRSPRWLSARSGCIRSSRGSAERCWTATTCANTERALTTGRDEA